MQGFVVVLFKISRIFSFDLNFTSIFIFWSYFSFFDKFVDEFVQYVDIRVERRFVRSLEQFRGRIALKRLLELES